MAAAIKRSTLKLGMIPADGIGKEVIPVGSHPVTRTLRHIDPIFPDICETRILTRLIHRLLRGSLRRLDLRFQRLSSSRSWLVGRSSTGLERLFLMRLSGESTSSAAPASRDAMERFFFHASPAVRIVIVTINRR